MQKKNLIAYSTLFFFFLYNQLEFMGKSNEHNQIILQGSFKETCPPIICQIQGGSFPIQLTIQGQVKILL